MSPSKVLFVCSSLIFASTVLGISLVSASSAKVTKSDQSGTARSFRFSREVVPGHVFYPLSVVRDKLTIAAMDEKDRCFFKLSLANSRLEQAEQLLILAERDTSLNTIVKGHHYLAEVREDCRSLEESKVYINDFMQVLNHYVVTLEDIKDAFSDNQRAEIDRIVAEVKVTIDDLD